MKAGQMLALTLTCFFALSAPEVQADSLRCGTHLIRDGGSRGDKMYEVLKKCGEPASRDGYEWTYRLHGRYWTLLFDGNGQLLSIYRAE